MGLKYYIKMPKFLIKISHKIQEFNKKNKLSINQIIEINKSFSQNLKFKLNYKAGFIEETKSK